MNGHEPYTALTKRAHLTAVIANLPAKRIEELEPKPLQLDSHMKRYEALAGRPLDKDLMVTVLIESCVEELRENMSSRTRK